jgi:hypothetical protein
VSFWQKQGLGLGRKVVCHSCGTSIRVPFLYGLAYILLGPFVQIFGGVFALVLVGEMPFHLGLLTAVFVSGMVLGTVPFAWFHHRYAPLVTA